MIFPCVSALTAGALLILQTLLGFMVSGARGKADVWVGDGGSSDLQRLARRHANLAENAGVFVAGFTLLELSEWKPIILIVLCVTFVTARLSHAWGLSRPNTNNPLRLIGGIGTYLIGFALGGLLIWRGASTVFLRYL